VHPLKNQLACFEEPVNDALNRLGKRLGDLLSCGLKNDCDVISKTSQSEHRVAARGETDEAGHA
jgi:hypothetical protein